MKIWGQKIINLPKIKGIFLGILSCKEKDEPILPLTLEKSSIEMIEQTAPITVTIKSGNGNYTAVSSAINVATTVSIVGNGVKITPVAHGSATIIVKDNSSATVQVAVTVTSKALENSARRFESGSTSIIFGVDTDWTVAGKAGMVEMVNVRAKTSYYLTWEGGSSVGKKTNAVLYKNTERFPLSNVEVVAVKDGVYYLVFDNGVLVNK
jgi:hypothetical protein